MIESLKKCGVKKVNEEEGVASMAQFEKFFIQIKEKILAIYY